MSRVVHLRTVFPLARTLFLGRLTNDSVSKSLVRPASTSLWCVCCGNSRFQRNRSDVTKMQTGWYCTAESKYPVCASIDKFFRDIGDSLLAW